MRPTKRLLHIITAWMVLGLLAAFFSPFKVLWVAAGAMLLVCGLVDILALWRMRPLTMERELPGRFAIGEPGSVGLTFHNPGRYPAEIEIFDGIPPIARSAHLPWTASVPAGGWNQTEYQLTFMERGPQSFTRCAILRRSLLGLWNRQRFAGIPGDTRIYPNYEPILRYALLAMSNRQNQMGIIKKNLRGASREFHQLRDYQDGDVLQQIDWKATSKRLHLISREYREQKDQNIVLMIDSGRRMRAMDGELSQFDHCLNAILLLSYIALRQGDQVGVIGFGGNDRWIPPVKGPTAMTGLLNHLYDYQATLGASDFGEAAEKLMIRQKRRALVIILTNLRSEDADELLPNLQIMQRRHLVLLASLRESHVEVLASQPVQGLDSAIEVSATNMYLEDRQTVLDQLRQYGILSLDSTAQELPIALTNKYLDIKQSGRL